MYIFLDFFLFFFTMFFLTYYFLEKLTAKLNQICSFGDYSPSREIIAMIYPLFEYTFLIYIILDYIQTAISYHKGLLVSRTFYRIAQILFPIQLFLIAMFRMIFVVLAYDSVRGHTAGFLCLMIALLTVTILNTFYVLQTKVMYSWLGGLRGTRFAAILFLTLNIVVCSVKIYLTGYVVLGIDNGAEEGSGHLYPTWTLTKVGSSGMVLGRVIDYCWMILNAIMPMFISIVRSQTEPLLLCTIDMEKLVLVDEDGKATYRMEEDDYDDDDDDDNHDDNEMNDHEGDVTGTDDETGQEDG